MAVPIVASLILSFTGFGLGNLRDWFSADFVGVDNYTKLFDDERFLKAVRNTAVFVVVGVPLTLAAGLLAAVGLNQAIGRIQALFRVGYYLPVVTSIVAIAVIWRYLLNPDFGLVNAGLDLVGIEGRNWLGERSTALGSIIALGIWRNFGFDMVIFLAALQGINPVLYEAARVDGATPWQVFWRITLPLLRPTILFLAVITSSGYLQLFEEPFIMTGGGPLDSTLSVAMYTYEQGFRFLNLGYASAVAYALFVAIVVLTFIQFRLLRSDET
ncbi:MAG: sugar ABC transporter permease [Actinobacteria bacterium]|nr:sugar ABC transporter permease [Actinomycetota bacterium]